MQLLSSLLQVIRPDHGDSPILRFHQSVHQHKQAAIPRLDVVRYGSFWKGNDGNFVAFGATAAGDGEGLPLMVIPEARRE